MIYGIEQSTDLRCPLTKVVKFSGMARARKWVVNSGWDTYPDPESARNHHHTFRYLYEVYGKIKKKDPVFSDNGSRDYPKYASDRLADYIKKYGKEIEHGDR